MKKKSKGKGGKGGSGGTKGCLFLLIPTLAFTSCAQITDADIQRIADAVKAARASSTGK